MNKIKIFFCGDVMLGRGIDQILPYPCNSRIYEPFVKDARDYVKFAEEINGRINYPVSWDYIWGDFLNELEKEAPDLLIMNLETSITTNEEYEPKGINYRMNPKNIEVLKILIKDRQRTLVLNLANNHILDYKEKGLLETIQTLKNNNILFVGAGENIEEAKKALILNFGDFPIIILGCAHISSGVPLSWQAKENKPGVNLIKNLRTSDVCRIEKYKNNGLIIFNIHWGPNWGYEISNEEKYFAHNLIDSGVDLFFGHSSHHFKGFEIYKDKLIVYGTGDFINDYEGIGGYEEFRSYLVLGYLVEFDLENKRLTSFKLLPFRIKKLRLNYCKKEEINWIIEVIKRESIFKDRIYAENNKIEVKI